FRFMNERDFDNGDSTPINADERNLKAVGRYYYTVRFYSYMQRFLGYEGFKVGRSRIGQGKLSSWPWCYDPSAEYWQHGERFIQRDIMYGNVHHPGVVVFRA